MLSCTKFTKTIKHAKVIIRSSLLEHQRRSIYNLRSTRNLVNKDRIQGLHINPLLWKQIHREYTAFNHILKRSGFGPGIQSSLNKLLHTSSLNKNTPPERSSQDNQNNNNDKKNNDEKKALLIKALTWMVLTYIIMSIMLPDTPNNQAQQFVSWNEFINHMVAKGEVSEVLVLPDVNIVSILLHEGAIIKGKKSPLRTYHMKVENIKNFEDKLREEERRLGIPLSEGVPVEYERLNGIPVGLLWSLLLIAAMVMMYRRASNMSLNISQMMGTKARYTVIDPRIPGSGKGVKFSDVVGYKEAKQEVMEFVDFLKNPDKYRLLGAKTPKGALLIGPPGCGKTLLAKAIATEGKVPFITMNGSEFMEMIGGVGASRVRDLFKEAKKRSPCIIYIDEIDAIGRKRSDAMSEGGGEGEQTLNQLLVEMDGMGSKEGVTLLGSTNRPDVLDKALLRPGRFDRHIVMELPNQEERQELFEHHLKNVVLENPVSYYSKRMASLSLGFSGADVANVVNEAALYAARNGCKVVTSKDLEYAIEKVVGGTEKRTSGLSPEERRVVAYHESGHALIGWLLEHTDALLKVTIVPRTNHALGFAQYSPKEKKLYNKEEIMERMCMALGGRVAESLTFNRITTGAQNDLDKVTKMAYAQVRSYGFSEAVGNVSFAEEETREMGKRPYSDRLTNIIDEEASRLIFECYKKTEQLLIEHKDKLAKLAEALLKRESLSYDEVESLIGPPSFGSKVAVESLQFEREVNSWQDAGKDASDNSDVNNSRNI